MIATDIRYCIEPFQGRLRELLAEISSTGKVFHGPYVQRFEQAWAEHCGAKHCVSCGSGEAALEIAAYALGLRKVSVQANTIICTVRGLIEGIKAYGSHGPDCLELIDVDWPTGKPIFLGRSSNRFVPVLLYGKQELTPMGHERVVDACQAHGWQQPECIDAACWSFYATKNLGGINDGGAITFHDGDLAWLARKYAEAIGARGRMSELNAGFLLEKLPHLAKWNKERQAAGLAYHDRLRTCDTVGIPLHPSVSNCHLFPVLVQDAALVRIRMLERGVECGRHYEWSNSALSSTPCGMEDFPGALEWCSKVLTLPCYPGMPHEDIDRVVEALLEATKT